MVHRFRFLQYYPSKITKSHTDLSSFNTTLVQSYNCTRTSVPPILPYYDHTIAHGPQFLQYYPSTIIRLYRIHSHVHISHMTFMGTYVSSSEYGIGYKLTIMIRLSLFISNDLSANYCPFSGFRSIPGYTNPFCDCNLIGGCFLLNRKFQITQ